MADTHALASRCGHPIVSAPFVSVDGRAWNGERFDVGLQVGDAIGCTDFEARLRALAAKGADDRRAVVLPSAVPPNFIGALPGRIGRIGMQYSFFPPHFDTSHHTRQPGR